MLIQHREESESERTMTILGCIRVKMLLLQYATPTGLRIGTPGSFLGGSGGMLSQKISAWNYLIKYAKYLLDYTWVCQRLCDCKPVGLTFFLSPFRRSEQRNLHRMHPGYY